MGCTNNRPKLPCLGNGEELLKISPTNFIKRRSTLVIENYQIGEKLGAGAYGIVRLAVHKKTGEKRAIKSIQKQKILPEGQVSKFFSEIDILITSDHPHIVKLLEFYEDEKYWHLVTEYVPGGELFDYIMKRKILTESTAKLFMKQLLSAVGYCHYRNIVHRDLKPENLLLSSDYKNLKIIDFGGSTILFEKSLNKRYGTSYYIAPEVLRGAYTEKCDMWSIGVILYIMLSGRPPFPGKKDSEILKNVEIGVYSFSAPQWSAISPQAKNLISRLLCYNPNIRISAKEALEHPWFDQITQNMPKLALEGLFAFHSSQKLQNAVLTFIASQLSQIEDFQEISEFFRILDKNGDGRISKEELTGVFEGNFFNSFLGNPEKIMEEVDVNRSGYIDYTEFLIACRRKELGSCISSLEATFKCFDIDNNGRISASELKEWLGDGGGKDTLWKNMIKEVDLNGDGELDIDEFKTMMLNVINK